MDQRYGANEALHAGANSSDPLVGHAVGAGDQEQALTHRQRLTSPNVRLLFFVWADDTHHPLISTRACFMTKPRMSF